MLLGAVAQWRTAVAVDQRSQLVQVADGLTWTGLLRAFLRIQRFVLGVLDSHALILIRLAVDTLLQTTGVVLKVEPGIHHFLREKAPSTDRISTDRVLTHTLIAE